MNLTQRVLGKLGIEVEDKGGDKRAYARQCPFHREKTGSWFIRLRGDRAGQHYCFGCKAKGGLVDLVMLVRDCSRQGAGEWLDKLREGEDVEGAAPKLPEEEVRLVVARVGRRAFELPREVEVRPLGGWPATPRRYAERRHLTARQVEAWGLGYATTGRLAGRLVIPVRDRGGFARSYMARTFADHDARYYYPMERERADPDVIFGEQHWPELGRARGWGSVVVAEGALNALAVERAVGGVLVAALGGSDVRPVHVGKLATFGRVVVLTDQDKAGDGAASVLQAQLARHTDVVRVSLGEGRDADDVDPEELRDLVCAATRS